MDDDITVQESDPVGDFHERARLIREEMGGADRVARMHIEGVPLCSTRVRFGSWARLAGRCD